MNFVDKQNVALRQIRQNAGKVARMLDGRARSYPNLTAHFGRDNIGKRGFAQARRAVKQNVIERLFSAFCRLYVNCEIAFDFFLTDVFGHTCRAKLVFVGVLIVFLRPGKSLRAVRPEFVKIKFKFTEFHNNPRFYKFLRASLATSSSDEASLIAVATAFSAFAFGTPSD